MSDINDHIEKEIMLRLRKGESRAFDIIFHLYAKRICHFAYSFLKNKQDSEEVVQEVFLRIWKNRKNTDEYYSFKSYLFTISYNVIIDKFRERLKDKKYIAYLKDNAITCESDIEKKIDYSDLNELYNNAVELLPKRRRIIYKMHRIKGLPYQEIAKKLNISPKTVENQMTSALKYLREKLGPETLASVLFYFLIV